MNNKRIIFTITTLLLALSIGAFAFLAPVSAQEATPLPVTTTEAVTGSAAITDTGTMTQTGPTGVGADAEGGPIRLVGGINYTDFSIPEVMQSPSPALLDMVHLIQGDGTQFAPLESQILGRMTSPVSPPPLSYEFDLPAEPRGVHQDLDNDGEEGQGVQVFRLAMASNINGGSYLEQLDQKADLNSYLADPVSGELTEGNLLIYAADDQQGFPNGFGDDGVLFTEDDPTAPVARGYTVVHFGPDGFTFDRAREVELNVLEAAQAASPDFSDQGMVESFNSLIDHLATHYSFTDLRQLDWEAIRAQYLPMVEEAEQLTDAQPDLATAAYVATLNRMAQSLRDAHVSTAIIDPAQINAVILADGLQKQPIATNIGANTVELDDGRIIITEVITGSPAAEAGLSFGTEVVAVNGQPVEEVLPTVVYNEHTGTEAGQRLYQVANLLKFPAPDADGVVADVTIDVKLPDADAPQSLTMTPGDYTLSAPLASPVHEMPISFQIEPTYGYLTWNAFAEPGVRMAVLEEFLSEVSQKNLDGMILDLRGNGGGWDNLYFTMASYFFNAENPVSMHWIDMDVFDPVVGDLVRETPDEHLISAPKPDLSYDGDVVILVDNHCASSCEFFTQFLQTNQRATVVAQHSTEGAGAPINRVEMPSGIVFQYTKGRSYFAGTEEFNLEAKGVTPDVKASVTEETELAKLRGGDPVLEAGVNRLKLALVEQLELQPSPYAGGAITSVAPAGWAYNEGSEQYVSPNGQALIVLVPYIKTDDTEPDKIAAALLPGVDKLGEYEAESGAWTLYTAAPNGILAVTNMDGKPYVGELVATDSDVLDALVDALLQPALDAFQVAN